MLMCPRTRAVPMTLRIQPFNTSRSGEIGSPPLSRLHATVLCGLISLCPVLVLRSFDLYGFVLRALDI